MTASDGLAGIVCIGVVLLSMYSSERVPCNIVLRKWAVVFHPLLKITTIIFSTYLSFRKEVCSYVIEFDFILQSVIIVLKMNCIRWTGLSSNQMYM
ncbi:hypothetical protein VNO78_31081 [Psophocarpus tetragonolobus]|uniref:Uncharacterized protein n=1 Tax=Psophocarpus tetragonolobus TaxID=3891 RepID=A0AAN9X6X6_PSOTE